LFSAHELRGGYLRADPADRAAVERALFDAANLVGEFDKPRYIDFTDALCAHSRSRKTGCTRCLDVCPAGAIAPAGDHVAVDPYVCGGCGGCAAVCPTGAAAYTVPKAEALLAGLRALLVTYRKAGGQQPVVLVHDGDHGQPLIDALARYGDGLPANVLPLCVNETTQTGIEAIVAAFSYGATGVQFLVRARPKHDLVALRRVIETSGAILTALGYGDGVVATIDTDDPDQLRAALDTVPAGNPSPRPSEFLPMGRKRSLVEAAFAELHGAAPTPVDSVSLGAGAPFGGLDIDVAGCTLCLACVGACPTSALADNPERPMLRFSESLCVQCGLCAATCPEHVIKLVPQLDFAAWRSPPRVIKEEEPFLCIGCGKPFGTKSTIERVRRQLEGKHWMFSGPNASRIEALMKCETCRVEAAVNEGFDPYAAKPRPRPRTTEDYLRERAEGRDDLPEE
jgi:ferredoxin